MPKHTKTSAGIAIEGDLVRVDFPEKISSLTLSSDEAVALGSTLLLKAFHLIHGRKMTLDESKKMGQAIGMIGLSEAANIPRIHRFDDLDN